MPPGNRLAQHAAECASRLEADALAMMRGILTDPGTYATQVVAADDANLEDHEFTAAVSGHLDPADMRVLELLSSVNHSTPGEDLIQLTRWSKHRIVYCIDPDTAAAIADTDWAQVPIPAEALRRLPHPDPLVVLPEPIRITDADGNVEKYEAYLVLGVRPPARRCSTQHPDTHMLVLHFLGRVVDPITDRPLIFHSQVNGAARAFPQLVGMRLLTPLEDMALPQRVAWAQARVAEGGFPAALGFTGPTQAADVTATMARLALGQLVYLAADNTETRNVPTRTTRRTGRTSDSAERPVRVIEAGWVVGAQLRASASTNSNPHGGTGARTVRPHLRRAHLHTFRRGPGHSERFVKWLPPTPVGIKDPRVTQVHRIT